MLTIGFIPLQNNIHFYTFLLLHRLICSPCHLCPFKIHVFCLDWYLLASLQPRGRPSFLSSVKGMLGSWTMLSSKNNHYRKRAEELQITKTIGGSKYLLGSEGPGWSKNKVLKRTAPAMIFLRLKMSSLDQTPRQEIDKPI